MTRIVKTEMTDGALKRQREKGQFFLAKGYPPEWGQQISACFKKR